MRPAVACLLVFAVCLSAGFAQGEDWPQWRGPKNDGISSEKNLPIEWDAKKNVAWRVELPGSAGATPVVSKDRIFLTSTDGDNLVVMCLSTEGKILWKQPLGAGNKTARGDEGNSASPSPSTDGKHVFVMMGTGDLAAFDFEGNVVWKLDLQKEYGRFNIQFGMTSTPVLDGDRLYLQLIHSGGAFVIALDKATGKEIWKQKRTSDATAECEHSYASPVVYRDDKNEFLLTHGADYIIAHRLSDGAEIWRCGGLNPKGDKYNPTLRLVASPAAAAGLIVVPSAKNGPVLGLRPDGEGNITGEMSNYHWRRESNTPDVPSPLVVDGLVYLCRENGVLICVDAKTGQELYQERTESDRHRASPVYADGYVYLTSRRGTVSVIKAGPKFERVATNPLGEEMAASPVISNGRIYLRTFDALWAIEKK